MKNTKHQYKVIIERDEDGVFIASVPELPGCHTQGKTMKDLDKNIREVISLCLEIAKKDKDYRLQIKNLAYTPSFIALDTVTI